MISLQFVLERNFNRKYDVALEEQAYTHKRKPSTFKHEMEDEEEKIKEKHRNTCRGRKIVCIELAGISCQHRNCALAVRFSLHLQPWCCNHFAKNKNMRTEGSFVLQKQKEMLQRKKKYLL